LKIATWNVNSLRVRLPHLTAWLAAHPVDIIALQETKLPDADFPTAALETLGYHVAFNGQRTYNGVATLAREPLDAYALEIPGFDDTQRRVLAATVGRVRVINVYVPNGQTVGSEKYAYKLRWLAGLRAWLADELREHPRAVVLGDFNIAPEDRDVHDPAAWAGSVLVSDLEREALQAIVQLGLTDTFRLFEQPPQSFSWWDYRMAAFRRNRGLRIDHILASGALAATCRSCDIDREPRKSERPSDHAPVTATFDI